MHVSLNFSNFSYYAFNPLSDELSSTDQKIALIGTIMLGFTFGLGHLICGITYGINKKEINANRLDSLAQVNAQVSVVAQNIVNPSTSFYDFNGSFPLNSIFEDDNQREMIKTEPDFSKNFKEYLDSIPVNQTGYSAKEKKALQDLKKGIVDFTMNFINDPQAGSFDDIHSLTVEILKEELPVDDEISNFLNQLTKDQVIGGWGTSRVNLFLIFPPTNLINDPVIGTLGSGSYYHLSGTEIIESFLG